jgi:hypothetical protein
MRPVMVDTNLIRYLCGDELPDNDETINAYRNFSTLTFTGAELRICLPQRVELIEQQGVYERALRKKPENRSIQENCVVSAIEMFIHADEESVIEKEDVSLLRNDCRKFGFGSALADLMISFLAKKNGWSLVTAEGSEKPMSKYIRHHNLEP